MSDRPTPETDAELAAQERKDNAAMREAVEDASKALTVFLEWQPEFECAIRKNWDRDQAAATAALVKLKPFIEP